MRASKLHLKAEGIESRRSRNIWAFEKIAYKVDGEGSASHYLWLVGWVRYSAQIITLSIITCHLTWIDSRVSFQATLLQILCVLD